jgi:hypothetical protein
MMNANVSTQRRIQRTHAKFVAISAAVAATNDVGGEDGERGGVPITGPQAGDVDADDREVDNIGEDFLGLRELGIAGSDFRRYRFPNVSRAR